jgi:hypothetical protein
MGSVVTALPVTVAAPRVCLCGGWGYCCLTGGHKSHHASYSTRCATTAETMHRWAHLNLPLTCLLIH